ncbi:hypothetical protein V1525DRAFT_430746 [Lipomyces kononenkoae]|uniref:Uncharacterized protein n=1 Tax=Lipomyces kononenkoae TaxID=34357 RepID=A0ACC3T9K7_LIPKO
MDPEGDAEHSVKFCIDISRAIRRLQESTSKRNIRFNVDSIVNNQYGDASLDLDALASLSVIPTITSSILCAFYPLFPDIAARWLAIPDEVSVTAAFARLLCVIPHIAIHADAYFESGWKGRYDLEGLIALYRLLIFDKRRFGKLVKPNELLSIISDSAVAGANRMVGILIWALHFDLSDARTNEMVEKYLGEQTMMGEFEGEKDVDFLFFTLFEGKRVSLLNKVLSETDYSFDSSSDHVTVDDETLSLRTANLCGVLVPRYKPLSTPVSPVIYTRSTINNVRALAMVLRTGSPLLITGPPGSGKSFLIDHLLSSLARQPEDVVKLHLGEQTDTKLLVGSYSTGETPGSFVWKQGILASAVKQGKVVVVEDIDKAPNEVVSVLLSLVQQRQISVPSRGEIIRAANSFQIIATITDHSSSHTKDFIGRQLWSHVRLEMIDDDELQQIVSLKYPRLRSLAAMMRQVYAAVREAYKSPKFLALTRGSQCRTISTRDVMKWAGRVDVLLSRSVDVWSSEQTDNVPTQIFDTIFYEAVDTFAGSIISITGRELVVAVIGGAMNIAPQVVHHYLSSHVPVLEDSKNSVMIGRVVVHKPSKVKQRHIGISASWFAHTKHTLRLLEQIATCVTLREPVLLVGETGTGKTTVVQQLSSTLGAKLVVINVSQQTEASDLLGGYKPVDVKTVAGPLREEFDILFENTFSSRRNERFTAVFSKCFLNNQWTNVIRLWKEAVKMAHDVVARQLSQTQDVGEDKPSKRRRVDPVTGQNLLQSWENFAQKIAAFEAQYKNIENSFVYRFIEGALVRAVRNGHWVLLDEINLAAPDTLEHIADLLTAGGEDACIHLSETGDMGAVQAHPNFRLFACMNPATDVGKRDLPPGFRSRFTEIYVASPDQDPADLLAIVQKYIGQLAVGNDGEGACQDVVNMYLEAKQLAEDHVIVDGAGQKPHFSIRTLSRMLVYVRDIAPAYGLRRALYEGFCMAFLTLLDKASDKLLAPIIVKYTIAKLRNPRSVMSKIPNKPEVGEYIQFKHYWLEAGPLEPDDQEHYIITPFVEKNLLNLVRATATRRFPVLIQGPTSSGKTSMISYLAKKTGHKFVRINNHEHTDLQEYLGSYVSDSQGNLRFQEGILVEAARKGYWIVLDELNLAPTDVLEALNRLLDDNREIFIPETQEVVKPHPHFLLFASQNPPGLYGGRKNLSRAFRNRFLELHFDDIPEEELGDILTGRCKIPPSYAKRIVEVYKELAIRRQSTRLFEKNGFATLRDLFRWAMREAVGYDQLALNGYLLLAERVRRPEEQEVVKEVIEKVMRVHLDIPSFYKSYEIPESKFPGTVWNNSMRRLFCLVNEALKNREPVLLVGETGCGKTTVCQLLAEYFGKALHIVNAHQNTEASDIIGAQRPLRNRSEIQGMLAGELKECVSSDNSSDLDLDDLLEIFDKTKPLIDNAARRRIEDLRSRLNVLFEWCDGSLVQALRQGDFFLLDEISLTDDSVLERLNSVLEPERSILLAEKGSQDSTVSAADGFQFLATMNPGGDYGKKELSPALRNRFTEIWVPAITDIDDVYQIVHSKLGVKDKLFFSRPIVMFARWFGETYGGSLGVSSVAIVSIREILSWIAFINATQSLSPTVRLVHGASMVYIDTLGTNTSAYLAEAPPLLARERLRCIEYLSTVSGHDLRSIYAAAVQVTIAKDIVQAGVFHINRDSADTTQVPFSFSAPTTAFNAMRIIRGMQLRRPIMLEGSPGVGKSSIMVAIAAAAGVELTRINLSEQTDLMDLFGADSPVEGGKSGEFVWRDAPFLHAMQHGHWVLLDEMNLASQSVLEGLNACLDHRAETYIPELDRTFTCHPQFKVFAAQNSHYQGGGRKGLPKSFVNRFTVVYVDLLTPADLNIITRQLFPDANSELAEAIVEFVSVLETETSLKKSFGRVGSPWEFNLRDTIRWFQLLLRHSKSCSAKEFLDIVVRQRFRTPEDRSAVDSLYEKQFHEVYSPRALGYTLSDEYLQVGHSVLQRMSNLGSCSLLNSLVMLQCNILPMESLMTCVEMSWPAILTGPSNSGKTSLIRLLACLVGARLEEFAINNDIDSMDIVGGFEQVDLSRRASTIWDSIRRFVSNILADVQLVKNRRTAVTALGLFYLAQTVEETSVSHLDEARDILSQLYDKVDDSRQIEINSFASEIGKLKKFASDPAKQLATFEWYDGILVRAVEEGYWLVLDNANLCGPSVLDRLNSLLEPNGVLVVNERGLENGQLKILKPHPNFRLFLTVDPRHGELSRAMRNRGIEIFMDDLHNRASAWDKAVLGMSDRNCDDSVMLEHHKVLTDFSNLSLESVPRSFTPLARYIPVTVSKMRVYGLLDTVPMIDDTVSEKYRAICTIDQLPVIYDTTIARWASAVHDLSLYSDAEKAYCMLVAKLFETFNHFGLSKEIADIYRTSLIPNYGNYQTYYLLSNPYGLAYASVGRDCDATEFALAYDTIFELIFIKEKLDAIESQSETVKISQLNYIERSAAVITRSISIKSSKDIFVLLKSISHLISAVFERISLRSLPKGTMEKLSEFLDILEEIISLTDRVNVDESQFPVYRDMLDVLSSDIEKSDSTIVTLSEWNSLQRSIRTFSSRISLRTGKSMETIWHKTHLNVPTSSEAWDAYLELLQMSKKLDAISSTIDLDWQERLVWLQQKLLRVASGILDHDDPISVIDPSLRNEVDKFLASIPTTSIGNGNKERWANIMDVVLRSEELYQVTHDKKWDNLHNLRLANLSGRALALSIRTCDSAPNLQSAFSTLFSDDSCAQKISESFSGGVVIELINALSSLENGRVVDVAEIRKEIGLAGSVLGCYSSSLCQDKHGLLLDVLLKHMHHIMCIHEEHDIGRFSPLFATILTADSGSEEQLVQVEAYLQESGKETICLVPLLQDIRALFRTGTCLNQLAIGRLFTKYSEILWYLYLPSSPHDPAIKPYVEKNRLTSKKLKLSQFLNAAKIVADVFTGQNANLRLQSLESKLSALTDALPKPTCFRPEISQSHALFQELHRYYESYISEGKIDALVASISSSTSRAADIADMFQKNSYQLLCRLHSQFPYYADLFGPLETYLYFMNIGVGLISSSYRNEANSPIDVYMWMADASVLRPCGISRTSDNIQTVILEHGIGQDLSTKVLLNLLEWSAVRLQAIDDYDDDTLECINNVMKQLYYQWSLNKKREEAEKQAGSIIYKPLTNEEEQDQEFKQMFPDYDQVILLDHGDERRESEGLNVNIFDSYLKLFSGPRNSHSYPELMDAAITVLNEVSKTGLIATDRDIQHVLPAVMIRTGTLIDMMNGSKLSPMTNFYADANLAVAEEATNVFLPLQTRLVELVARWPEHETLRDALMACQELLGYATVTPAAKFLNQVEKELSALHEWQKLASSEFAVSDHIDKLSRLVIDWRRLELSSWSSLFDKEAQSMKKKTAEWLFYLYENAIAVPTRLCEDGEDIEFHVLELLQGVTALIGNSPKGQFATRLQLVQSVATHAGTIKGPKLVHGLSRISRVLRNVTRLYEQFVPIVEESIQSQRKTLEKEISETILLASWKDTNFLALKESARRSHHKLYQSVRKFREILRQPVRSIVDSGLGEAILKEDMRAALAKSYTEIPETPESVSGYVDMCSVISGWDSRPERLIDISSTSKRLNHIVSEILAIERPSLVNYAADLIENMQQLRKETPSTLTDENKASVQYLKARKAKLLSETLKDLKRMGLKFRVRSDILRNQDSVVKILTGTQLFDKVLPQNFDDYFFHVLEMTPRVRSSLSNHSDDLTVSQVQRGLGCAESLLHVLISQREAVIATLSLYGQFKQAYNELAALGMVSAKNNLLPLDLRGKKLSSLSQSLRLCCSTIDFGYSAILAHMKLCQDNDTGAVQLFTKWKTALTELASRIDKIAEPSIVALSTADQGGILDDVYSTIGTFYDEIVELASTRETYRYIVNIIVSYLTTEFTTKVGQPQTAGSPRSTVTELDHALRTLSDSILVVIQNIRRLSQPAIAVEDDNWVTASTHRATKILQSLQFGSIVSSIEKCLIVVNGLDVDDMIVSTLTGALVSLTMPLLRTYTFFAENLIYNAAADHASMAKSSLILMKAFFSVVSSGYCSPQEASDAQSDSGAQGTGLGEGEGEQNISNTVGNDEDLTDLANQPNEEKADNDKKEDDDAVDMDGEIEGEPEEVDGQEKEDEASEGEDENDEELDEEVGDVDHLDPSAVDEKLWDDGNIEESSNEKNTTQNSKDSTRTDDLAAKTEEQVEDNPEKTEDGKDDMEEDNEDEEEEAMEQEDKVKQHDNQDIEPIVPDGDTLDLPEDLNLDNDEDDANMDDEHNDDLPSEADLLDNPMEIEDESHLEEDMDGQEKPTGTPEAEDVEMENPEKEEGQSLEMAEDEESKSQLGENEDIEEAANENLVEDENETAKEGQAEEQQQERNPDSQAEGLHGPEDALDDFRETEAAAKGSAGREDAGQDAEAQETTAESSTQEAGPAAINEVRQESMVSDKSDQTQNHQHRLGDSREEWHRQNREIQEAEEDAEESIQNDAKKFSDEYRHMDEADATHDTQALGTARNDQLQTIEDDSMAIDDEQEQPMSVPAAPQEQDESAPKSEEQLAHQQHTGAIVGDRTPVDDIGQFDDIRMEEEDLVEPAVELPTTAELQVDVAKEESYRSVEEARDLWQRHERSTADLSAALCEQLRLILEPTLATKLRGDFRTGKRLNMKRIIPYIASGYKKDKIWLRRTKPSKREYQIMIALDDSKSMSDSQSVELAFDTLTLVTKALERLESGQLSIVRFGETCEVVHHFQKPFTSEAGAQVFQWFGFTQVRTNVHSLVEKSMALFDEAKSDTKADMWQLEIIISDGVCGNHDQLQRLVRRAREQRIMLVFIVIDGLHKSAETGGSGTMSQSILDMKQVAYETDKESGQMSLKMTNYLSSFPFEFYVIVRSISELPSVLALVLRQYFTEIAEVRE